MIFISFSKENCINLRSLLPESTIQWLVGREIEEEEFNMLREYKFHLVIAGDFPLLLRFVSQQFGVCIFRCVDLG